VKTQSRSPSHSVLSLMDLFVVYDTKGSGRVIGVFDDLARAQSVTEINCHYFRLRRCTLNSVNSEIVRWALSDRECNLLAALVPQE